jgi:hypothetical protein
MFSILIVVGLDIFIKLSFLMNLKLKDNIKNSDIKVELIPAAGNGKCGERGTRGMTRRGRGRGTRGMANSPGNGEFLQISIKIQLNSKKNYQKFN